MIYLNLIYIIWLIIKVCILNIKETWNQKNPKLQKLIKNIYIGNHINSELPFCYKRIIGEFYDLRIYNVSWNKEQMESCLFVYGKQNSVNV